MVPGTVTLASSGDLSYPVLPPPPPFCTPPPALYPSYPALNPTSPRLLLLSTPLHNPPLLPSGGWAGKPRLKTRPLSRIRSVCCATPSLLLLIRLLLQVPLLCSLFGVLSFLFFVFVFFLFFLDPGLRESFVFYLPVPEINLFLLPPKPQVVLLLLQLRTTFGFLSTKFGLY